MQKRGYDGNLFTFLIWPLANARHFTVDDLNQPARTVKDANRMSEARMSCSWKYQFGYTKLSDTTQPLKLTRIDELPRQLVERFPAIKDDQSMNGISQPKGSQLTVEIRNAHFPRPEIACRP